MSVMAQALVKAGLIEKERTQNLQEEKEFFLTQYKNLSKSIGKIIQTKRNLIRLQKEVIAVKKDTYQENILNEIHELIGTPKLNLNAEPNRVLILDKIKENLDALEKLVFPMIKASRKIEDDWGFTRKKDK